MPDPITALWEDVARHTRYNSHVLTKMYREIQQREAEKVPGDWRAGYAIVHSPQAVQVVGKTHRRSSLTIQNLGPSIALLCNRFFDGAGQTLAYNRQSYESVLDVLPLAVGQSTTIPTSGAVYAYSLNYGTGSNEQAALQIIQTLFDSWQTNESPKQWLPEQMALMERGLDADGYPDEVEHAIAKAIQLT